MGLETAAIITASIAGAAEISKAGTEMAAVSAEEKALDLQSEQSTLKFQQKQLNNYDTMDKVIKAQIARATVRGFSMSSPSFNAIQRNTLNVGAKEAKNLDIEQDLEQSNIETEKENVRRKLYATLFGDAAGVALAGENIVEKWPFKS
jgi:hypothetical protein